MTEGTSVSALARLDAWEAGLEHPPASRALLLLAAAYPDLEPETLLDWPVGRRDLGLLALHEVCFGRELLCVANCPACRERLEVQFATTDLIAVPSEDAVPGQDGAQVTVSWEGRTLHFRLPTAGDLIAVAHARDLVAGQRTLLERCSLDATADQVAALPEPVVEDLSQRMAQADPQADIRLALDCPSCGHAWSAVLDIAAYLWAEVDAWARRTLLQVHTLAGAYGWSEVESLALSARRRQHYLDLIAEMDRTAI